MPAPDSLMKRQKYREWQLDNLLFGTEKPAWRFHKETEHLSFAALWVKAKEYGEEEDFQDFLRSHPNEALRVLANTCATAQHPFECLKEKCKCHRLEFTDKEIATALRQAQGTNHA